MTAAARAEEATLLQECIAQELVRLDRLEGKPVCLDEDNGCGPCRFAPEAPEVWCEVCSAIGRPLP